MLSLNFRATTNTVRILLLLLFDGSDFHVVECLSPNLIVFFFWILIIKKSETIILLQEWIDQEGFCWLSLFYETLLVMHVLDFQFISQSVWKWIENIFLRFWLGKSKIKRYCMLVIDYYSKSLNKIQIKMFLGYFLRRRLLLVVINPSNKMIR